MAKKNTALWWLLGGVALYFGITQFTTFGPARGGYRVLKFRNTLRKPANSQISDTSYSTLSQAKSVAAKSQFSLIVSSDGRGITAFNNHVELDFHDAMDLLKKQQVERVA